MSVVKSLLVSAVLACACYAQSTARLEFEAASVKPSPPTVGGAFGMSCRGGPGTSDPGLFRCENFNLASLMNWAYQLRADQLSAPDWMNVAPFDITAKVSHGATPDQLCVMLQNLLVDRFKLTVHHETRESTEYRLVVAKGGTKFKPAAAPKDESSADALQDPSAPKAFRFDDAGYPVFAPGESGTRSTFNGRARMYEPRVTMHWLAAILSADLHGTVIDATGLDGQYEISLYWILDAAPKTGSADDSAGPTLVQALQRELGLRLETSSKGTKDVLVVDHAERVPTAN
jgi:uncharacterized protein (TIGR03435 family)